MRILTCRKLNRVYRTERRKVSSYIVPMVSLVVCVILGILVCYLDISTMTSEKNSLTYQGIFHHRSLLNASEPTESPGEYPEDMFTLEQRRKGAVILHIIGMCYMFLAIALACDEFFVPSLVVIIERLQISEDVAGATFMAAGGSAPELFTSFFGTFADPNSNVGIGTIVGSAVFNVLFVIGMCAMFSKGVLELTWWPLFRDCMFYSFSLLLLIIFFIGDWIQWWESLLLLSFFVFYAIFMKYNRTIERIVKNFLRSNKVSKVDVRDPGLANPGVHRTEHYLEAIEYLGSNAKQNAERPCFHYGAFQLVVNSMDPLWDASIAVRVKHIKQMSMTADEAPEKQQDQELKYSTVDLQKKPSSSGSQHLTENGTTQTDVDFPDGMKMSNEEDHSNGNIPDRDLGNGSCVNEQDFSSSYHVVCIDSTIPGMCADNNNKRRASDSSKVSQNAVTTKMSEEESVVEEADSIDDFDDKPIDLSWPEGWKERLVYIIKAPIMFPLYFSMFDVRKPEKSKFYPWTFIVSIFWIGIFSYLTLWWAVVVGDTFGIHSVIMGLTVLAGGTSIPDLITSVLVARKGFGDMAVSSSIGSNLFDITVGLPLPWLLYSAVNLGKSVNVSSDGLLCSIVLLFGMLIAVVLSIAILKWRMSKLLGAAMFLLYIVFIIMSLLLEYKIIPCIKIV
ncbi:sodium/potassium/calcium exchanger 2-like isoform X2 [Actinia tenebrosa]|uniref:Sodium/potassium/calcium exchanger 2-like isoform X2 n=1 Tax=Actinia tenebrosa TaxID=6105 RepID=A0A6P8I7S0_ACTTE|nr:sodium/potassium/calcium exchanger 2-like isoform X2 [Actinia tenebrosa]